LNNNGETQEALIPSLQEVRVNQGQEEINVQQEKRKSWMEKKKLVTFIAGVINATHEIKSK